MSAPRLQLAAVAIADPPQRWRDLGFGVGEGGRCTVGSVVLTLGVDGDGITGWTLRRGEPPRGGQTGPGHRNGALAVDHIVIVTPDFEATAQRLASEDLALRRVRQAGDLRQGFRRLGPTTMELVEAPEAQAERFWGLTVAVADLDRLAREHEYVSRPRPAVQPGRHIATLDRAAGLSTRLAFMDPE